MSRTKQVAESIDIAAEKVESQAVVEKVITPVKPAYTAPKSGKMSVQIYLTRYPKTLYEATILKSLYPHSFFTKEVWDQKLEEALNRKVES